MIATTRLDQSFDTAFAEMEDTLAAQIRGMAVQLWNGILAKTPQFGGRMAASWTFSVGAAPVLVDRSDQIPANEQGIVSILWRAHPRAVGIANFNSKGAETNFKLGDTIWIANGVDHGQGPYSAAVENGEVNLRSMNQPGAPVARTLAMIQQRYGNGVPRHWAQRLKNLTIGGGDAAVDP